MLRFALLMCLLSQACAPQLLVRHDDPRAGDVDLYIDGRRVATLEPGDRWRGRRKRGFHVVALKAAGSDAPARGMPMDGLDVCLDEKVELTLLPPVAAPAEPPAGAAP